MTSRADSVGETGPVEERPPKQDDEYARLVFGEGTATVQKDILRPTTLIGAAPGCNIQLVAPEVSDAHCVLSLDMGTLRVRDLRSRTGTKVNGLPVDVTTLNDGDRLEIGRFVFRVDMNLSPTDSQVKAIEAERACLKQRQRELSKATALLARGLRKLEEERRRFRSEQRQGQLSNRTDAYARLIIGEGTEAVQKDILRPTTLIGAAPGCNMQLVAPEVSDAHCVISLDMGTLRVRDLRSRTGVKVNGLEIDTTILSDGDKLQIGPFVFRVEMNLSGTPSRADAAEESQSRRRPLRS